MNHTARTAAYARQNGTEKLTAKQRRRAQHKVNAGVDLTVRTVTFTASASVDRQQFQADLRKLITPPEEFTPEVNPQVRVKVGIITYTGFVVDNPEGVPTFHYETRGGVQKFAKKFTVLDD